MSKELEQIRNIVSRRFPGLDVTVSTDSPDVKGWTYRMRSAARGKEINFAVDGGPKDQVKFWQNTGAIVKVRIAAFYKKHKQAVANEGQA